MRSHASWQELLGPGAPGSHVVQLYDSDEFLAHAVGYFAAEGMRRGEAVLLTGTAAHLDAVQRKLGVLGIDPVAATRSGQLSVFDVMGFAAAASGGALDRAAFDALVGAALAGPRAEGRFRGLRWWGETSNVLLERAGSAAAMHCEDLGDALAKEHQLTMLCSFCCDRFDPRQYGVLKDVCCKHSHLIPANDYARYRTSVNRAIRDVVGELTGSLLQKLARWKGLSCDQPSSQAILFWLREAMPEHFADVLARARAYHAGEDGKAAR